MEVRKTFPCEACGGQGGWEVGVEPDIAHIRRADGDINPELSFKTEWKVCGTCDGIGAVERWVWVGP